MPTPRITCQHGIPRYTCQGCYRLFKRERMAYYRAHPEGARLKRPCPHGSKYRNGCRICSVEDVNTRQRFSRDRRILRDKGRATFPFESFNPIMELI